MSALEAIGVAMATGFGFGVGMKVFSLADELLRLSLKWWFFDRHQEKARG